MRYAVRIMADYSKPKPIDPLWYQPDGWVNASCPCGHHASARVRDLATCHQLNKDLLLHQLLSRLRCSKCGQRPLAPDVTRNPKWR